MGLGGRDGAPLILRREFCDGALFNSNTVLLNAQSTFVRGRNGRLSRRLSRRLSLGIAEAAMDFGEGVGGSHIAGEGDDGELGKLGVLGVGGDDGNAG